MKMSAAPVCHRAVTGWHWQGFWLLFIFLTDTVVLTSIFPVYLGHLMVPWMCPNVKETFGGWRLDGYFWSYCMFREEVGWPCDQARCISALVEDLNSYYTHLVFMPDSSLQCGCAYGGSFFMSSWSCAFATSAVVLYCLTFLSDCQNEPNHCGNF